VQRVREIVDAGGLDGPRAFVAELAHSIDIVDLAAAAVALLQKTGESKETSNEPEEPSSEAPPGPMTVVFVGAGRSAGIRPGDLVGAITGEAHITSRQLGKIHVGPHHSLVEVPEPVVERVIRALRGATLRGQKVDVRRHKGGRANHE
jgi:ATP-dependent RNA helicase DeaD